MPEIRQIYLPKKIAVNRGGKLKYRIAEPGALYKTTGHVKFRLPAPNNQAVAFRNTVADDLGRLRILRRKSRFAEKVQLYHFNDREGGICRPKHKRESRQYHY